VKFRLLLVILPVIGILSVCTPAGTNPPAVATPPPPDEVLVVGEELIYNVSYASVNLGQVRARIVQKKDREGGVVYAGQANIDSYKTIPFVDLHAVYDNLIAPAIHSEWFRSRLKGDKGWDTVTYSYDYPGKKLFVATRPAPGDGADIDDTLSVDAYYQDGLSLFYYARSQAGNRLQVTVPTVVNEKKGTTTFDFLAERTSVEIDAVDYPVDVVHFKGEAGFVGIYGLTGEFEGWFSNDAARVPILARMKVLIGSVRIELMKWKRGEWKPPASPRDDH
jgi:hypothetical protein